MNIECQPEIILNGFENINRTYLLVLTKISTDYYFDNLLILIRIFGDFYFDKLLILAKIFPDVYFISTKIFADFYFNDLLQFPGP